MVQTKALLCFFGFLLTISETFGQCPPGTTPTPTLQICGATAMNAVGACAPSLAGTTVLAPPFPLEIGLIPDAAGCALDVVAGAITVTNVDMATPCLSVAIVTACVANNDDDDDDDSDSSMDSSLSSAESGGLLNLLGGFGSDSRRKK